jgi:NADH pyrophosphatase NudC (nudix superfamily)/nicotinamide mononucleotide (NMN) deamidase PncC
MSAITSPAFRRLVQSLKRHKKTLTVVEQCCGGLIQTSIMAQPGASSVFVGGSVPYNTKKGKGLLLNNETLHQSLLLPSQNFDKSTEDGYIQSKFDWTSKAAKEFCQTLETDYAVSEGGAAGPTFNPKNMEKGFAVLSVAGRTTKSDNDTSSSSTASSVVHLLDQKLIRSRNNDREGNMRLFADAAAELLTEIIESDNGGEGNESAAESESIHGDNNKTDDNSLSTNDNKNMILDRSTTLRTNETALNEMKPAAKYVVIKNNEMLFRSPTELAFLSYEGLTMKYDPNVATNTFLGRLSDEAQTPLFSIDVIHKDAEDEEFSFVNDATDSDYFYANVRTNAPLLNTLENEIALHSMAYANWQKSSKFCTSCGSPLELIHGGTAQKCTCESCRKMFWPRQDPSMIASISSRCGTKILLARSPRHPPRMHTVLAGFVEAGETFEKAVARETWEESGIRIDEDSVKYVGSQPWPFPQSTMVAFEATADETQPLNIDETELVEARWFDKEEVRKATQVEGRVMEHDVAKQALEEDPTLPLLIPPKRVIARKLIDNWLQKSPAGGTQ